MLFKKKEEKIELPDNPLRDPLLAVPIVPDHVEQREGPNGLVYLRSQPTVKSSKDKIILALKQDYSRKVELDELGSTCYKMVNGKNNLKQIAKAIAKETKQSQHEANIQVLTFFRQLMLKNLVALKIEE